MDATVVMDIATMESDQEAWLEARRKGICGTDCGCILGVSPWYTAFDVWMDKKDKKPKGSNREETPEEEPEEKEIFYWGHKLEPVIAAAFEERTGKKVTQCGMLRNNQRPWQLADVDRLVDGENAILEIKTTSAYNIDKWDGDNIPDTYYLQVQHYMAVGGFDRCYIACLVGGQKLIIKTVERNEADIEGLIKAEEDFWVNYVQANRMPPGGFSNKYGLIMATEVPEKPGSEMVLTRGMVTECKEILELEAEVKKIENVITIKKNNIREAMGTCGTGTSDDGTIVVHFRMASQTLLDRDFLKQQVPEVYAKAFKMHPTRRLVIKAKKPKKMLNLEKEN